MVDHHQIGIAAFVHLALGFGRAFNLCAMVCQAGQNAAAAFVLGNEHARHLAYPLHQLGFSASHHNSFEACGEHGQVVECVACNDNRIEVKAF